MHVSEICNRDVATLERKDTVRDAAVLMRKRHVGDVVIVDKKTDGMDPVGILTDRDIVVELIADDVELNSVVVGEVMSSPPMTVYQDEDLWDTVKKMSRMGIRRIPVLNGQDRLVGILSVDDLLSQVSERLQDLSNLITNEKRREAELRS